MLTSSAGLHWSSVVTEAFQHQRLSISPPLPDCPPPSHPCSSKEGPLHSPFPIRLAFCFSLKKKFFFFSWKLLTLQYGGGLQHALTWISHGYTGVPPSWTPHPLPSPPHPSGLSQSHQLWVPCFMHQTCPVKSSILHMVIAFTNAITYGQCYSLILSHPCLFPQSPKVCSLYLCLFCCLAYRVVITVF